LECDKHCIKTYGFSTANTVEKWDNYKLSFCRQGCGLKWSDIRCEDVGRPLTFAESKTEALKYGDRLPTKSEMEKFMFTAKYKDPILPG